MLTVDWSTQSRFRSWLNLRERLEFSNDPLNEVKSYFEKKSRIKIYTDPYDRSTWPTPWELIDEDEFCQFNILLGICYTLQLTERFKNIQPKINVAIDSVNKTVYYMLFVDDKVYGYLEEEWSCRSNLPKTLSVQKSYSMPPLH